MNLELKKFGTMLISRPAGREAWLASRAYTLPQSLRGQIVVDFSGVAVLAPSWADEFLTKLVEKYGKEAVSFAHTENPSVLATLKTLRLT